MIPILWIDDRSWKNESQELEKYALERYVKAEKNMVCSNVFFAMYSAYCNNP